MITLEKAIEILTQWKKDNCPPPLADELNALNLSIEALKRIQSKRITMSYHPDDLLPGETKWRKEATQ